MSQQPRDAHHQLALLREEVQRTGLIAWDLVRGAPLTTDDDWDQTARAIFCPRVDAAPGLSAC